MTTNIDRAAEIINSFCCGYCEHFGEEQSHALADAGLLAPYLPEPTRIQPDGSPEWTSASHATIGVDGNLVYSDGALLTPGEAREEAAMILAAADHAERSQKCPRASAPISRRSTTPPTTGRPTPPPFRNTTRGAPSTDTSKRRRNDPAHHPRP